MFDYLEVATELEAEKVRSQMNTSSGHYVKCSTLIGRFMDVKTSNKSPFKDVKREK